MSANPVTYAEQTLEVHAVYQRAQEQHQRLDDSSVKLTEARNRVRDLKEKIADREAALAIDVRAAFAEAKPTEYKAIFDSTAQQDDELKDLRQRLRDAETNVERLVGGMRVIERGIDIEVARLNELAGLMNFYAARAPKPVQPKETP